MRKTTITFIGAGNMTGALTAGLIANGYDPDHLWATNRTSEKLLFFKEQLGIHITQDNREGANHADVLLFAVKPDQLHDVCNELKDIILANNPLVISIAVGVTVALLQKWLDEKSSIIRAMPNIAASVQAGAAGLYANHHVSQEHKDLAESIFRAVGSVLWLDEEAQIDTVIALSGSGPAYFFLVMEAMQKAAESMGLPPEIADLLTSQTALGASKMALESNQYVEQLRRMVTSPKGATSAALKIFEEVHIRQVVAKAMEAASQRSKELATLLDE